MQNVDSKVHWLRGSLAAGCLATALASGCTAQVETATYPTGPDEDVVAVETVPADVYAYPRTEYRGHVVYYVNGRWYSPRGRHWYTYRTEPQELVRHRRYIQQAPPAARPVYRSDEAIQVR